MEYLVSNGNDNSVDFKDITIDFFPQINLPQDSSHMTLLSWLSFAGLLFMFAMIILWIVLILRTGVGVYKSRGTSEGIQDGMQRMRGIFTGIILTFVFPILISIVGAVYGIGWVWDWPVAFYDCEADQYNYYYQALLDQPEDEPNPVCKAHQICGTPAAAGCN